MSDPSLTSIKPGVELATHAPPPGRLFSRVMLLTHRWLGVFLSLQVLLWMLSGVVMAWFHVSLVRGETYSSLSIPTALYAHNYVAPGGIIARSEGATQIELSKFLGDPVYVTTGNGQDNLFNALTGEKISPLREETALKVAALDYAGDATVRHARLLSKAPPEYRGPKPVWQIEYKDNLNTRLYISPYSGKVVSRRNKIWRLYDFFWMLHIMDYGEREDFNNPLLKITSVTGLAFAVTGFALLLLRLFRGFLWRDLSEFGGYISRGGRKKN